MLPLKDNVPTSRFPILTVALIAINVAFFIWQLSYSGSVDKQPDPELRTLQISERDENSIEFGAIPYRVTHPGKDCGVGVIEDKEVATPEVVCEGTSEFREAEQNELRAREIGREAPLADLDEAPWFVTLFTSMFMHGGILHIAFNMLFLWVFGNNVEDAMGRPKFLLFYLAAGLAAVYAQSLLDTSSTIPTIGASGAVAGVLGAYALLHPRARVLTLIFIIFFVTLVEIPAMILLGIWFILQFLPAVGQVATPELAGEPSVAYFAHVGGFIFGLAVVKLLARNVARPEEGPRLPVY
jgi:membrane associated rhomboid family serine protease